MRISILAAGMLALIAGPAAAQTFPETMDEDIARALPHPFEVEEAGDKLGRAIGAILQMPIGNVVRAIDPRSRVHPDETLAAVAGRDDPYFADRMQDQVGGLTLGLADMMRQMAVVAPVLRRSLADLERNLGRALTDPYRD